jgi:hypothetical protein
MDDTIEQLLKAWIKGVNDKYGCSVKYEECTTWEEIEEAISGLNI